MVFVLDVRVSDSFTEVCLEDLSEGLPVKLAIFVGRNSYSNSIYLMKLL